MPTPLPHRVHAHAASSSRACPRRFLIACTFCVGQVLFTEYTPGAAERHRQWHLLPAYAASLRAVQSAGYRVWHLGGSSAERFTEVPCVEPRSRRTVAGCRWASLALPALREVSEVTVAAEARNAENMLAEARAGGASTFHIPWDLHPRSLHSEFGHNTDLLAVHRDALSPPTTTMKDAPPRAAATPPVAAAATPPVAAAATRATTATPPIAAAPTGAAGGTLYSTPGGACADAPCDGDRLARLWIPTEGQVGVGLDSPYGLGGGLCSDTLADGTLLEAVGRLCLPAGTAARADAIAGARAHAERNRTRALARAHQLTRKAEAAHWRYAGPCKFSLTAVGHPAAAAAAAATATATADAAATATGAANAAAAATATATATGGAPAAANAANAANAASNDAADDVFGCAVRLGLGVASRLGVEMRQHSAGRDSASDRLMGRAGRREGELNVISKVLAGGAVQRSCPRAKPGDTVIALNGSRLRAPLESILVRAFCYELQFQRARPMLHEGALVRNATTAPPPAPPPVPPMQLPRPRAPLGSPKLLSRRRSASSDVRVALATNDPATTAVVTAAALQATPPAATAWHVVASGRAKAMPMHSLATVTGHAMSGRGAPLTPYLRAFARGHGVAAAAAICGGALCWRWRRRWVRADE